MEAEIELVNPSFTDQLSAFTITDTHKAWYLSAVLLSLRRPVRPIDLGLRCKLFYTTPELIEFLCSIPNSPLCLTPSYYVTFSSIGYLAVVEFLANSNASLDFLSSFRFELGLRTYFRKRKRIRLAEDECFPEPKRRLSLENFDAQGDNEVVIRHGYAEAHLVDGNLNRGMTVQSCEPPMVTFDAHQLQQTMLRSFLFINSNNDLPRFGIGSSGNSDERGIPFLNNKNEVSYSSTRFHLPSLDHLRPQNFWPAIPKMKPSFFQDLAHHQTQQNSVLRIKAQVKEVALAKKLSFSGLTSSLDFKEQIGLPEKQVETVVHPCATVVECLQVIESNQEVMNRECAGNQLTDMTRRDGFIKDSQLENVGEGCNQWVPDSEEEKEPLIDQATLISNSQWVPDSEEEKEPPIDQATLISNSLSPGQCQLPMTSAKSKLDKKQLCQNVHSTPRTSKNAYVACSPLRPSQTKRDKKSIPKKQLLRSNIDRKMGFEEKQETANKIGNSSFISSNDQLKQRALPNFESFVVEEEEGSGGYGTVYRARRKTDGVTFAIKSPHVNANRNHVHNEQKLLERFGGKSFVIRYEGSVKSGNSDCLVLEHVDHDRPEVLKKEIDVGELQWYGYCMFRALAGLHKQGIVHRDVKPGNFLFNRRACKGYLIDFNLAMDLNHKYCNPGKTKEGHNASYHHVPLSSPKPLPPTNSRKFPMSQDIRETNREQERISKPLAMSKDTRKKIGKYNPQADGGTMSIIKSQGADGSGITSAKDATSTKTPSAEKFREPLPCRGRKELLNLVQEALQVTNRETVTVPVSKRKRVAAPLGKVDPKFVYLTPMPLQSAGGIVGGARLLKSKGDGKLKREGPCVGTKGFRAPEVLFRSQHQGPKIDIWSAGVTLLYLMIGRTPFAGEPDQNAKEIAKLRGSEDLWEVAKLHNRESSFPAELFDIKFLATMKLKDWCKLNTKRPDFLEIIPNSLFDIVDKCLAVNPRLRISAEEALRHEFFFPCHEALRKHRMQRQGVSLDNTGSFLPIHGHSLTSGNVS